MSAEQPKGQNQSHSGVTDLRKKTETKKDLLNEVFGSKWLPNKIKHQFQPSVKVETAVCR